MRERRGLGLVHGRNAVEALFVSRLGARQGLWQYQPRVYPPGRYPPGAQVCAESKALD